MPIMFFLQDIDQNPNHDNLRPSSVPVPTDSPVVGILLDGTYLKIIEKKNRSVFVPRSLGTDGSVELS